MVLAKLPEETKTNTAKDHCRSEWTVEELQAGILKKLGFLRLARHLVWPTFTNRPLLPSGTPQQTENQDAYAKKLITSRGVPTTKGDMLLLHVPVKFTAFTILSESDKTRTTLLQLLSSLSGAQLQLKKLMLQMQWWTPSNHLQWRQQDPLHQQPNCRDKDPSMADNNTVTLTTLTPPQHTKNTTCLLKTTIANVVRRDWQTEANVLFDEGSQLSFLKKKGNWVGSETLQVWEPQPIVILCWQAMAQTDGGSTDPHIRT